VFTGGVNEIVACPLPLVTVVIVGVSGVVAGVIALLALELALFPRALVAVTVKVYVRPFVRPVTMIHEADPVALRPPMFDVTV
jgi:hypothetical protein